MIKRKINTCISCNKDKPIYARKMCGMCYQNDRARAYRERQKNKPRKRIKPISDKRAELLKRYRVKRDRFMANNPICQAKLNNCTRKATDLHHQATKFTDKLYLNEKYWMALCRACHTKTHNMGNEAYELGLLVRRSDLEEGDY